MLTPDSRAGQIYSSKTWHWLPFPYGIAAHALLAISLYRGASIFSESWCEVQAVIEATLGIASILTMGLIAFNRYIRVVKQALYNRLFPSKRTAQLYRGVVWIASTFFATPPLCGWGKVVYHRRYAICNFVLVIVGSGNTTTTAAIFYCYYKIYKILKESKCPWHWWCCGLIKTPSTWY